VSLRPSTGVSNLYEPLVLIAEDQDAFEAFYRDHVDAVQRFVARRVDDPHLAADLTAEVFLAAIDGASSYAPNRGPVIAWLYGVGRRIVAAEVRRRRRELHAVRRISGRRSTHACAAMV
jgi:RNA polymerase sigma-70 factor, ECF subfamily